MKIDAAKRTLYLEPKENIKCRECKKEPKGDYYFCETDGNVYCRMCRPTSYCENRERWIFHEDILVTSIERVK